MTDTERLTTTVGNGNGTLTASAAVPLTNRSSDTNLLDSCVDDDDDEDDDHDSVKAYGSEEYSPYIDPTGRQHDPPNSSNNTNSGEPSTPVTHQTLGLILGNITPPATSVSPINAITPEKHTSYTPQEAEQPFLGMQRKISVSPPGMEGIELDINQPWERSLLRQLEVPNTTSGAGMLPPSPERNRNIATKSGFGSPTTTTTSGIGQPQHHQRKVFVLGHTESRDYAMDCDDFDDAVSLETSSSCPPAASKMQYIHRSMYNPPQPHVVSNMVDDDVDDDENNHPRYPNYQYPTASNYYHSDHHHYAVPPQYHPYDSNNKVINSYYYQLQQQQQATTTPPKYIKGKNYYTGAASTLTYDGTNLTDDGRDDHEMMMASVYNMNHINDQIPKQHQNYLEMEAASTEISTNGMDPYIHKNSPDLIHSNNNDLNNNSIPDPGCFCLGYNMLEYIISSSPPTGSKQRNNSQGRYHHRHHLHGNNGVLHPVRLPMVQEIDGTMTMGVAEATPPTMNLTADVIDDNRLAAPLIGNRSNASHHHHLPNEPDGRYVPPTDQYYSTTSYERVESI